MPFRTNAVQRTDHIGAEILRSVVPTIRAALTGKISCNNRIGTVHISKSAFIVCIRTDGRHADNIGLLVRILSTFRHTLRNVDTAHLMACKGMMSQLNTSRTGKRIRTDGDTAGHFIRIFRQRISASKPSRFIKIIRRKAQATFLFTAAVQDLRMFTDSDTRQIQPVRRN